MTRKDPEFSDGMTESEGIFSNSSALLPCDDVKRHALTLMLTPLPHCLLQEDFSDNDASF
ncbi:hypothetical protein HA39_05465 [Pantoea brenneri]|nr:hypothetical protein HA39_05465 [Pantoea brenneri]